MTTVKLRETIDLTDIEKEIFDLLRNFKPDMELRVAGGWVRDKLLGENSDDIDIAIDTMSGKKFVIELDEYLRSKGKKDHDVVIMKSERKGRKDLETAKMVIKNQWIDFVQLRSEEECEGNSRIPVNWKRGTPEEDAYRRDLTINSLFYDIHTGKVEDHTKRGIDDLKSGRIVTPLTAKTIFLEDPLRVLRAIRFGTRFGFTLDQEITDAASCKEVRDALVEKTSRERIGHEIDMMITGNRPVSAVSYLSEFKLFGVVFALPSSSEPAQPENCCRYMEAMWNLIQTPGLVDLTGEQRRLALYATLFLPFRETLYKDDRKLVRFIFKHSIKRSTRDAETVIKIHRTAERFLPLILPLELKNEVQVDKLECPDDVVEHWESISLTNPEVPATSKLRLVTGLLLRDIKDLWRVALLASLLLHTDDDGMDLDKIRGIYLKIKNTILEMDLDQIWDVKPLTIGNAIIENLKKLRDWEKLRFTQQKMLTWQLAYPEGSEEECINWMNNPTQNMGQVCDFVKD